MPYMKSRASSENYIYDDFDKGFEVLLRRTCTRREADCVKVVCSRSFVDRRSKCDQQTAEAPVCRSQGSRLARRLEVSEAVLTPEDSIQIRPGRDLITTDMLSLVST